MRSIILLRLSALSGALLATTALTAPARAQAIPDLAPPERVQVDENGVDLTRGTFTGYRTDLAIGPAGRGGLRLVQRFGYNISVSAYDYGLFVNTTTLTTAGLGLTSVPFTQSGSTYTAADGSGARLVKSGLNYTLTLGDGTVVLYNYTLRDSTDGLRQARASTITYPTGEKITLSWATVTWCSNNLDGCMNGHWLTGVRLQAVSSSLGYQIHYNYGRADVLVASQAIAWRRLDGATAINTTVDACDPSAHSCSFAHSWPSVAYPGGTDVTDPLGRTSSYTQGSSTFSIRRASSVSANVTYSFDSLQHVTSVLRDGLSWSYSYGVSGSTATMGVTEPGSGRSRTIVSDLNVGLPTSVTDELGHVTTYTYDTSGRVTRITAPEGNYVQYGYDARGNVSEERHVAKSGSGIPDLVTSAAYPSSCTNVVTCNLPTSTTDARGNVTDYTYDATHGGVLTATAPAPATGGVRPQVRTSYSALTAPGGGSVYRPTAVSQCRTTSSCANGADETRTTIAYSQANLQPSSVTVQAGDGSLAATTAIGYDYIARPTSADGPLSGSADTNVTRYDLAGEVIGTVGPDPDGAGALHNRAQRISYNADGQVSRVEAGTVASQSDADWAAFAALQQVDIAYDAAARPVRQVTSAGGTTYGVSEQSYDSAGRADCSAVRMNAAAWGSATDACTAESAGSYGADRISRTSYDLASRVTQVQTGYATGDVATEAATTYTNNGRVASVTDAMGNRTSYVYDGLDRPSQTQYPSSTQGAGTSNASDYEQLNYATATVGGSTVSTPLVASRRLRDATSIAYAYDNLGRVTGKDLPGSEADVSYTYDLMNHMLTAAQSSLGHTLTFTYDALGRETSEAGPLGTMSYGYDLAGRRTSMTYPGSTTLTVGYSYDDGGDLTQIRENPSGSNSLLATYAYDDLGRRTSLTRGNGLVTSYSYDAVSRLTQIAHDLSGSSYDETLAMSYDPAGGMISRTSSNDAYAWGGHYAVTRGYTANGLNQYTASGSITPTYDANGNLTSIGAGSYYYTSENRLTHGPDSATLVYDPLGRLYFSSSTSRGNTWLASSGGDIVAELDGGSNILRRYVFGPGGEPLVWYEGSGLSTRRYYHADERGSVVAISDGSGAMYAVNSYDEYGIPAASNTGRFLYAGQFWVNELGMSYNRARLYSPSLGRFLQTDPIGFNGGMNIYGYTGNDPVNFTDPSGLTHYTDVGCTGTRICVHTQNGGYGGTYPFGVGQSGFSIPGPSGGYYGYVPGSVQGSGGDGPGQLVTVTASYFGWVPVSYLQSVLGGSTFEFGRSYSGEGHSSDNTRVGATHDCTRGGVSYEVNSVSVIGVLGYSGGYGSFMTASGGRGTFATFGLGAGLDIGVSHQYGYSPSLSDFVGPVDTVSYGAFAFTGGNSYSIINGHSTSASAGAGYAPRSVPFTLASQMTDTRITSLTCGN